MKNKKIGYVAIEIIIILTVVFTSGVAGTVSMVKNSKTKHNTMVEKTEEVYSAAWNGDQGGTENNVGGNTTIKTEKATLVKGIEFNATIPNDTTKIIFTDIDAPNGKTLTDVSEEKNNSIVSWIEGTTYYVSTQNKKVQIVANDDCYRMFYNKVNVEYIDVGDLETKNVTSMNSMFQSTGQNTDEFEIYGLDNWDVSSVVDMTNMFNSSGRNAKKWNIGKLQNWKTTSCKNMSGMFASAGWSSSNFALDLSNWDMSNVTTISSMFNNAGYNSSIWNIGDLSNWNTSNITNMFWAFGTTGNKATEWTLGNLDNWDVSKVQTFYGTFYDSGLYATKWSIGDLSKWKTSSATNMSMMFGHTGFKAINFSLGDLSKWDVSKVSDMSAMFVECGYYSETWYIGDIKNWDVTNAVYMNKMFYRAGARANHYMDLTSWTNKVQKVTNYTEFNFNVESKVIAPEWLN